MTNTDAATEIAQRLGTARGQLGLDDAAFEVFTQGNWRDAYCYTDMIEIYRRVTDHLNECLPTMVYQAQKRDGATWTDIGTALNISRQAAQQRFGR